MVRVPPQADEIGCTSVEFGRQPIVCQPFAPAIECGAALAFASGGWLLIAFPCSYIVEHVAGLDFFLELAQSTFDVVILYRYRSSLQFLHGSLSILRGYLPDLRL